MTNKRTRIEIMIIDDIGLLINGRLHVSRAAALAHLILKGFEPEAAQWVLDRATR
jgi:hypothetical protein